ALIEFEANVPLFFDPYAGNRATGSFILIDALSNATVGAGMIEEPSSDRQRLARAEFAALENASKPVTVQERYWRHGHCPAIFLLENEPALALRLERALFEHG